MHDQIHELSLDDRFVPPLYVIVFSAEPGVNGDKKLTPSTVRLDTLRDVFTLARMAKGAGSADIQDGDIVEIGNLSIVVQLFAFAMARTSRLVPSSNNAEEPKNRLKGESLG